MNWRKLGKVIECKNLNDWMVSHTSVPFAVHLWENVFRFYFSVRNKKNQSQASFVDFDLSTMQIVNQLEKAPLLSPGGKDDFDTSGVTLSCYCAENDTFYYLGWHLPKNAPFANQIGLASFRGDILEKYEHNPVLGQCEIEPYTFGYPWVVKAKKQYFMWYDTNFFWNLQNPKNYKFPLRVALSSDGINWKKCYHTCIELKDQERAIARPCVIYENDLFKMWYSIDVGGKYKLGYAQSEDGLSWLRLDDEIGISNSLQGWDSEEIAYPCVFDHQDKRYMLYNGNEYGKTGFGLAILEN